MPSKSPRLEGLNPTTNTKARVFKACERCKLKKVKCEGVSPCRRCKQDDVICLFKRTTTRKRVDIPPGYVEFLETRYALLARALRKSHTLLVSHGHIAGLPHHASTYRTGSNTSSAAHSEMASSKTRQTSIQQMLDDLEVRAPETVDDEDDMRDDCDFPSKSRQMSCSSAGCDAATISPISTPTHGTCDSTAHSADASLDSVSLSPIESRISTDLDFDFEPSQQLWPWPGEELPTTCPLDLTTAGGLGLMAQWRYNECEAEKNLMHEFIMMPDSHTCSPVLGMRGEPPRDGDVYWQPNGTLQKIGWSPG